MRETLLDLAEGADLVLTYWAIEAAQMFREAF